jgi:hypothetical protein
MKDLLFKVLGWIGAILFLGVFVFSIISMLQGNNSCSRGDGNDEPNCGDPVLDSR